MNALTEQTTTTGPSSHVRIVVPRVLAAAPAYLPASDVETDDDAYFHPGGRIRSLFDAQNARDVSTLPPPPRRARRPWLGVAMIALLLPLALVPAFFAIREHTSPRASRLDAARAVTSTRTELVSLGASTKGAATRVDSRPAARAKRGSHAPQRKPRTRR